MVYQDSHARTMSSPPVLEPDSDPCPNPRSTDNFSPRNNRQPILPPLPQQSPPLARSPSPRHHASTASSHPPARRTLRAGNISAPSDSPSTPTRQRQQSPSYRPPLRRIPTSVIPPTHWGEDTTDDLPFHNTTAILLGSGSDNDEDGNDSDGLFLSTFADNDFSSPSTYPPFTTNLPASEAPEPDQTAIAIQPQHAAPINNPGSETARHRQMSARSTTRLSSSSLAESQNTSFTTDNGVDPSTSQGSYNSFSDKMPPRSRFPHILNETDSPSVNKRTRTSRPNADAVNAASARSLAKGADDDYDDLFGENSTMQGSEMVDGQDLTTIDLTEATKVPEELKMPQEDNRIKVSQFQCVICMDDATALTVTHCGHLYCAQCLHSSVHVEATKGKCPMCRAKIDTKPRSSYNTKTKGFWHLELKLVTAAKGKRKADKIS